VRLKKKIPADVNLLLLPFYWYSFFRGEHVPNSGFSTTHATDINFPGRTGADFGLRGMVHSIRDRKDIEIEFFEEPSGGSNEENGFGFSSCCRIGDDCRASYGVAYHRHSCECRLSRGNVIDGLRSGRRPIG
jgi:hypothetical protein